MEEKKWWKESVVYQIYPRSFMDSNGDGIGDLNGIIRKLDYLKDLGIDVIWVSPIYESPNDDNGYDISNYKAIMKEFGTMEDFDILLIEAHKRNLKIVMDLVFNHTSDEHPWFIESRKSLDNPYRDYYIWKPSKNGKEPNNWGSWFSGPAWEYSKETDMYYLHIFSKKQPDLNWENKKVREELYNIIDWWCQKGVDGFRMDVINFISKDQSYTDGPKEEGQLYGDKIPYIANGPRVHEFLQEMNKRVLSNYDLITVGETTHVTTEDAKQYAGFDTQELNMVFQFEHMTLDFGEHGKWSAKPIPFVPLKKILSKWQYELEGHAWNSLYWENHDQPRIVSRLGNDSREYRELSAKMLGTCLLMMKGTPYIYQGQELGMTNIEFRSIEDFRDVEIMNAYREFVDNKLATAEEMIQYFNLKGRDNARTPMQWDDSSNAGFTTGTPWIKLNPNYTYINAKNQVKDKTSVYSFYKELIRVRKEMEVLVYGAYALLEENDENLYIYTRTLGNTSLLIICNFTAKELPYAIEAEYESANIIIHNYPDRTNNNIIRPYEAVVYCKN